jgi:hypothetical protein
MGMVFSINAPASGAKTFQAYQDRAMGNVASTDPAASSPPAASGTDTATPTVSGVGSGATQAPLNAEVTNTTPAAAEASVSISAATSVKFDGRLGVAVALGSALLSSMIL